MEPGRWHGSQRMPVVRVSLVLAALSWTSWAAGHRFLSGCISSIRFPVGHPGRLPQWNVPRRPYNIRGWMQAHSRQASVGLSFSCAFGSGGQLAIAAGNDLTRAVRADGQLVCFGRMRCSNGFGTRCGACSRQRSHVCSQSRWSVGLLWTQQ